MISKPENLQFLKAEDVIGFKKNTCIFCNQTYNFLCKHESGTRTSRNPYSESEYTWTSKTYFPADLDLNIFTFSFSEEEQKKIQAELLRKKLEQEIKGRAQSLRMDLEKRLQDLPETLRKRTIDVAVGDIICEEKTVGLKISKYMHYLFFADLATIFDNKSDYGACWDDDIYYKPNGIKAHLECWPYQKATLQETKIEILYPKFLKTLEKSPRFKDYRAALEEHPEMYGMAEKMKIELKFKRYNPLQDL